MVKFGPSVRPSGCLFLAIRFLFIRPSSFGRLGQTLKSNKEFQGIFGFRTEKLVQTEKTMLIGFMVESEFSSSGIFSFSMKT